ncbi:hypothetical protein 19_00011 [Pseudomonas phage Epa19]|uniref:Putative virion structural protein n=1 Tax=Pseudomonas phage Epa5 TaxID=2719575 RepID=A0A6G9LFT9_9CAUD|nr:head scaffolding protein [Pseudomonas phage Epa5]QIQ64317.1 putative virion structural protein [Pseudomonas phage Epa5]QIQ65277.1 hypothetical protein 19_00011 [Pseudomonas phage Epa19]
MDFEFQEVESLDNVPEQFRGLYAEADGKYKLNDTYKGVAEAVTGLNRSLKASRAEAKAFKGKADLSPLAEFGEDPASIAETVKARLQELEGQLANGDKAKLNVDKIKEDLAKAHSKDLEKVTKRSEALQTQLYGLLVENAATTAIAELKGVPELLMPFVKTQVNVLEEDGEYRVFVVDGQGDRRYSGVTGQPMSIKELVAEMKANEKFGRLFESEAPQGGGTPPGQRRPVQQPRGEMSATDKIKAGLAKGQAASRGGLGRR